MSLKLRLALLNTFFVLLALGVGFALLIFQSRRVFLESIDRDLQSRADRMMHNPRLREDGLSGAPGMPPQNGPRRNDQPDGPGQPNGDQGGPQGPGYRPFGSSLGPEFGGPPNDDLGRPVLFSTEGKPFDSRETKTLDAAALARHEEQRPILTTVAVEGVPTRVATVPLRSQTELLGYAQFGHDLQDFERLKGTQTATFLLLIPVAIAISGVVGWVLSGMAVRPIQEVARASEKISGSDMSTRLTVKGNDEIGRLSLAFNAMVDRLQLSFDERQKLFVELQNTLEQQRQFVADASHELRTPLARLRITTSSALEQESSKEEMKEALEIADRETVHMSDLVDQLLTLARLDSGHAAKPQILNLSDVAKEAAAKFPEKSSTPITLNLAPNVSVTADHDSLLRAVVNLVENAQRYAPEKEIILSTQIAGDKAILVVRDHGPGIEPQHLPHLTERFYRVDDARSRKLGGTGLGLAIVKSIVESSGGRLSIQSKLGEGTAVQLIFPVQNEEFAHQTNSK